VGVAIILSIVMVRFIWKLMRRLFLGRVPARSSVASA
jgi:hypothetical protein